MARRRRSSWQEGILLLRVLMLPGVAVIVALFVSGCARSGESPVDLTVKHRISPMPPRVGPASISLGLTGPGGEPITGARITVDCNMSHPGMGPVIADAREIQPGQYDAPLSFSMGGDWIVLLHITLADGRRVERQFDVKGVSPS
jgi:YtkA-like